jgi:PAS domain S-box-containing protein
VDADLKVVFVSENFKAITGRNIQDHLGRHISHIRDGREFLEFGGLIADYFANPRPFSALESSIRTVDGRTLHVESNGFPIFDESGELKGWRGSNTDITAEIDHKREISKAIQQLNEISKGTRTWFWEVDNELKFTYLSDSIEDITGYRKDELLQKKVFILHPEEVVQDISKNHPAHLQQGKALRNLKRIVKTKSGELLHCSTSSVPLFDKNGLLIGYQGSSTDYTEEYQMREEWHMAHSRDQLLLDSFPDSLLRITSDGYILDMRTSEEHELHQYINEYQNHYINDLFPAHRAEFFMGGIHRSISSQSSVALDFVMRNKAKILKHYEARITPILHEHGQVLVLVRDVTDKVLMKKSLDRTMEDLKRSNEELEQFAYVASHDLQEPIRQVSSYLKLLVDSLQNPLEPKQLQYLVQAQESCQRMKKLVHDLLEFSKLTYDKRRTHRVNLNDLFSPILLTFDRLIRETSADIKIGRMPHVNCDPVLISQVFQNLISNSLKFHKPDRNPVICIAATIQNEYCHFQITDNGVGISERDQERIFAIFNRGSNATGIEGAGIGMAICKKIIESHGGKIWVDKEYSNGTKISFTLRDAPYSN